MDMPTPNDLLPDGITVERDVWAGVERFVWIVRDQQTGLAGRIGVDPERHMKRWEPSPAPRWWHYLLSPMGTLLETVDRNMLIGRMHNVQVVDWDEVDRLAHERGNMMIRALLARRK